MRQGIRRPRAMAKLNYKQKANLQRIALLAAGRRPLRRLQLRCRCSGCSASASSTWPGIGPMKFVGLDNFVGALRQSLLSRPADQRVRAEPHLLRHHHRLDADPGHGARAAAQLPHVGPQHLPRDLLPAVSAGRRRGRVPARADGAHARADQRAAAPRHWHSSTSRSASSAIPTSRSRRSRSSTPGTG